MTLDFFQCPRCAHHQVLISPTNASCRSCHTAYPVINGIPLLVPDAQSHMERMSALQAAKPQWFAEDQLESKRCSYRAHMKKRKEHLFRTLKTLFPKKTENVLDLGCGDGNHLPLLGSFAHRLFGGDYNFSRLIRAKAAVCPVAPTLFLGDIGAYPVCDSFFDLVFFHHVIEHIQNDVGALQTAHRILKPGGILLLGAPNEGALWWQLAYRLQPRLLRGSDHAHFYTKETLSQKLIATGFKIMRFEYLGYGIPHWTLDRIVRQWSLADDLLEFVGKKFFPKQASSIYVVAAKGNV